MLASFLVMIACAAWTGAGLAPASAAEEPKTLEIGAAAPDFRLKGVDDKMHSLTDFAAAKILVIVFTANHCPTAQAYEERLKKIAADYKDKGVAVVAIGSNDPKALRLDEMGYTDLGDTLADMKIRARDAHFNFPYLYDGDTQEVAKAYGARATPHVFVFTQDRKLRYQGRIDNTENEKSVKTSDLRNALDALLAGRPVPVEKTNPFGCSMKWSDKRGSVEEAMRKLAAEPVAVEPVTPEALKELLANKSDNLRLVNFWATFCGPCVTEMPELVTMNRMYRNRPFEFVTVSLDDPNTKTEVLQFLKKQQASNKNYHFTSDDRDVIGGILGEKWGGAIPYTLLIRPGGEVIYRREGAIEPLTVKREIVKNLGARK
jgi:thiol-disulfide isomerase/thioredoxin